MDVVGRILRTISLAILFGGSSAIVFAVIVLVHAAKAKGIPVTEAAATNAPVFINYSKVALGCGIALLIGEALDYAKRRVWNKLTMSQYFCSLLCVVGTMIFALAIVPPMERTLPHLTEDAQAKIEFDNLHNVSQKVFGATILLALASLVLPVFGALQPAAGAKARESA